MSMKGHGQHLNFYKNIYAWISIILLSAALAIVLTDKVYSVRNVTELFGVDGR